MPVISEPEVTVRTCRPEERHQAISIAGGGRDVGAELPLLFPSEPGELLRVATVAGEIVGALPLAACTLVMQEDHLDVALVGPTAVVETHRDRGVEKRLLRDAADVAERMGCPLSCAWPTSAASAVFAQDGWCPAATQSGRYTLDVSDRDALVAGRFVVVPFGRGAGPVLDQLWELHSAVPARTERGAHQLGLLLTLPGIQTFVAGASERIAGYLVLGGDAGSREVREAVGEPAAVEQLLRHALWSLGEGESLRVLTPPKMSNNTRHVLEEILGDRFARRRVEEDPTDDSGRLLVRINQLDGLLPALLGTLQAGAAASGITHAETLLRIHGADRPVHVWLRDGRLSVEPGAGGVVVDRRQAGGLLFGDGPSDPAVALPETARWLQRTAPVRLPFWPLDRA